MLTASPGSVPESGPRMDPGPGSGVTEQQRVTLSNTHDITCYRCSNTQNASLYNTVYIEELTVWCLISTEKINGFLNFYVFRTKLTF